MTKVYLVLDPWWHDDVQGFDVDGVFATRVGAEAWIAVNGTPQHIIVEKEVHP